MAPEGRFRFAYRLLLDGLRGYRHAHDDGLPGRTHCEVMAADWTPTSSGRGVPQHMMFQLSMINGTIAGVGVGVPMDSRRGL